MTIVTPALIQKQLDKMYLALEGTNISQASLFNLIFYTKSTSRKEYMHAVAKKVIERFPSRIFFVLSSDTPLEVRVSLLSTTAGEHKVACDFIEFAVPQAEENKIPFFIFPHLIPDLPVYVVWGEDPVKENPLLNTLQQFAHRLIFDSESTSNLSTFATSLLRHQEAFSQCDIADLNWARLESWRNILSSTFYAEDKLELLYTTQEIQICYNAQETPFFCHTRIQALYLQAWLACQLRFELQEVKKLPNKWIFSYKTPQGTLPISLSWTNQKDLPPGAIVSLDLWVKDNIHYAFMRRPTTPHQITLVVSTKEHCEVPAHFAFSKEVESGLSLVREICHKGTSEHYLNLLKKVATMEKWELC